ncbi:MAG: acetate/propionate family kinase [Alphaproteobacteria bacterium]|nr:acetate/propionate family kinase [Alphaproteobacteria bacterium]
MNQKYLFVINSGSSSVKFRLFGLSSDIPLLAQGTVNEIGGESRFSAKTISRETQELPLCPLKTHEDAIDHILAWLAHNDFALEDIKAAAHRIVHGGSRFSTPEYLDEETLEYLHSITHLAPLHQPHNLISVDILEDKVPDILQYGCFDTAFHANHDPLFTHFALPLEMAEEGVLRYGFHGLSYDWIASQLEKDHPKLAKGKVVIAHLGNGASLCALKEGKSIDSTMGMTALDGLPMGTRTGAIDAGAIMYIMDHMGYDLKQMETLLYKESGLKGLSGISNDIKVLCESDDENAKFAVEYFAFKTAQYIAAMAVSIGGMDALVFTAGIGENATSVREMILKHLEFMPNFEHHVIPTNEERRIAEKIWEYYAKDILGSANSLHKVAAF